MTMIAHNAIDGTLQRLIDYVSAFIENYVTL